MRTAILGLVALSAFLSGCCSMFIVEAPHIRHEANQLVYLEGQTWQEPKPWYIAPEDIDDIQFSVQVCRHENTDLREDWIKLLLTISVFPKDSTKYVEYIPENIRVVARGDTLRFLKKRVWGGRCSSSRDYSAEFEMLPPATNDTFPPDSIWCEVDLSGVLTYKGEPVKFGELKGRLAR